MVWQAIPAVVFNTGNSFLRIHVLLEGTEKDIYVHVDCRHDIEKQNQSQRVEHPGVVYEGATRVRNQRTEGRHSRL